MPQRPKNFMANGPRPQNLLEDDIAALYEREHPRERRETRLLAIEQLRPNPFQARTSFTGVNELAESIRQHGFTSWLRVRPAPDEPGAFELVYGERRLRAARLADLQMLPCEIVAHTDAQMIEIGLAENIQRQDLDPLEEAHMFQTLIAKRGYTQRSLALVIGKDKGYVENRLALLRAPDDVQQMVKARPESMSAARLIAKVPGAHQRQQLISGVLAGTLTKQDVAARVRDAGPQPPATEPVVVSPARTAGYAAPSRLGERQLQRDRELLRATIARWTAANNLTSAQRSEALVFLEDELLPLADSLRAMLRGPDSTDETTE